MRGRFVAILCAAAVIVAGANAAAYAGKGRPLLLGRSNNVASTTQITNNGAGPALKLATRRGAPPLAVSSTTKVGRLNADLVDGHSAADLQTTALRFTFPALSQTSDFTVDLPGVARGVYAVSFWVIGRMFTADDKLNCFVVTPNSAYSLLSYGTTYAQYSTSTASGIVDLRSNPDVAFRCFTGKGYTTIDSDQGLAQKSHIVFTRIDGLRTTSGFPQEPKRQSPAPAIGGTR